MSRSYKHTPIIRDISHSQKFYKKKANKAQRKCTELIDGKFYKKVYSSWYIHDYSYWMDKADIPYEKWRKESHIRKCLGK